MLLEPSASSQGRTFEQRALSVALPNLDPLHRARSEVLRRNRISGLTARSSRQIRRLQDAGLLSASVTLGAGVELASGTAEPKADLQLVANYLYDALNRRVERVVVEQATTLLSAYDGWREVEELVDTGTANVPVKQFVWGDRLDEFVAYRRNVGAGWQTYFAQQLGHDSVTRLVRVENGQASVVERVEYDPFGKPSVYLENGGSPAYFGDSSSVGNPYLWKGHRRDAETGLVYMRNRYYSAALGRLVAVDPLGAWTDRGSLGNGYAYAGNAPQNFLDPFGLQAQRRYFTLDAKRGTDGNYDHYRVGMTDSDGTHYWVDVTDIANRSGGDLASGTPGRLPGGSVYLGDRSATSRMLDQVKRGERPGNQFGEIESMAKDIADYLASLPTDVRNLAVKGLEAIDVALTVGNAAQLAKALAALHPAVQAWLLKRYADKKLRSKLRKNLCLKKGDKRQAHHMVAVGHPRAEQARQILDKHGIDINSAVNGVPLDKIQHMGTHTNEYFDSVNRMLDLADQRGGRQGVLDALDHLRKFLGG